MADHVCYIQTTTVLCVEGNDTISHNLWSYKLVCRLNLEIDGRYRKVCHCLCYALFSSVVNQVGLETFSSKMMLIISSNLLK